MPPINPFAALLAGLTGALQGYAQGKQMRREREEAEQEKKLRAMSYLEQMSRLGMPARAMETTAQTLGYPGLAGAFLQEVKTVEGPRTMGTGEYLHRQEKELKALERRAAAQGIPGILEGSTIAERGERPIGLQGGVDLEVERARQLGMTLPETVRDVPIEGLPSKAAQEIARAADKAKVELKAYQDRRLFDIANPLPKEKALRQLMRMGETSVLDPNELDEQGKPRLHTFNIPKPPMPEMRPPKAGPGEYISSSIEYGPKGDVRRRYSTHRIPREPKERGESQKREDKWIQRLKASIGQREIWSKGGGTKGMDPESVRRARRAFDSQKQDLVRAGYDVGYIEQNIRLWEEMTGVREAPKTLPAPGRPSPSGSTGPRPQSSFQQLMEELKRAKEGR